MIGEGIHLTSHVDNDKLRPAGIAELAVAAITTLALRRTRSAALVIAITAAAAAATLLAVGLINKVFASL